MNVRFIEDEIPPVTALLPLAYAYMQVPCDIPDEKVRRMEHEIRCFAERKGWCLAAIFSEFVCGAHDALNELVRELKRADAHYVVVPTFRHLARNPLLLNILLMRLEFEGQAEVFEVVHSQLDTAI
jgi:DNA invertase Pin-like site-specific DNA recombinase